MAGATSTLVVCGTMDEPAPADPAASAPGPRSPAAPPAPFVVGDPATGTSRFAPLSPRVGLLLIALVVVGLLLWMARGAVQPFILGLLAVYLLDPPVRLLSRYRVPRPLSILIVYLLALVIVVEFLNLTLAPLIAEIRRFVTELPTLLESFQGQLDRLAALYAGLDIPPDLREYIDAVIADLAGGDAGFDPGILMPVLTGAGGLVTSLFAYLILPVWAFYILKDRVGLVAAFDRSLPPSWRYDVWSTVRIVRRVFGQWVRAQLLLGFTVGVATFVGLLLLSEFVDPVFGRYAVLLSVIAGVLELIPIIGPIIAAVPAVLLAATTGLESTVAALLLYTLVQQVENNVLVPKIQGDAIELHPAAVMFAIIVGGALAGLLGAILALPVTAAGRDVFRYLFGRLGPPDEGRPVEEERPAAAPDTASTGAETARTAARPGSVEG